MAISRDEINKGLNWRYATKAYNTEKKVSAEDWATLESAMRLAPSSYGMQEYKVITVGDTDLRGKLREAAYGQPQVTDASHFVVFVAKTTLDDADVEEFISRTADLREIPREKLEQFETVVKGSIANINGANNVIQWNARQAYISLGFLLQAAALLGIDASPMEGFDPAKFDEILGLEGYTTVVIAGVGYRDAENDWLAPLAKFRWSEDEFFIRR